MTNYFTSVKTARLLTACGLGLALLGTSIGTNAQSGREGDMEFVLQMPYFEGKELGFDGGARADIDDDAGFGMGLAYNYTDRLALNGFINWNSPDYLIERVLEDGRSEFLSSEMDTFNVGLGGDFYFSTGRLSPFISGVVGANYIDTNIPSGLPDTVCWWDPWYGYVCISDTPTHDEWSFYYGVGAGLRLDFGQSAFIKAGYYQNYMDFDNASGSTEVESYRLELGFKF
jgi:opacity protein-like surface antigen